MMSQRLRPCGVLAVLCCVLALSIQAATIIPPSEAQMIISSREIVQAELIGQKAVYDARANIFVTLLEFRCLTALKATGRIPAGQVFTVKLPGGCTDAGSTWFPGVPSFPQGWRGVLFLSTWRDGALALHNLSYGKYTLSEDGQTIYRTIEAESPNWLNAPQVTYLDSHETSYFLRHLLARIADQHPHSVRFEQRWFANWPLLLSPDKSALIENFTFLDNNFRPRWHEADSSVPVGYTIKADRAFFSLDVIHFATQAWASVPGASIRFAYAGVSGGCFPSEAGRINYAFEDCTGQFPPGSNALAVGGFSQIGSRRVTVNGVDFGEGVTGIVFFNPNNARFYADANNAREIAVHETGHAIGAGHSQDGFATMAAVAHFDGRGASFEAVLKSDDRAFAVFVYPANNQPPPPTPTPTPNPTPNPTPTPVPTPQPTPTPRPTPTPTPPAPGNCSFADVPLGHQYYYEINAVCRAGLMVGYGSGRFGPSDPLSCAQINLILVRLGGHAVSCSSDPLRRDEALARLLQGVQFRPGGAAAAPFADVPLSNPFVDFIYESRARNWITGCDNGNAFFCPDRRVTRAELAEWLVRMFGLR